MTEAAAQIAREARSLQQSLKELLKNRDILDKDIDITRKNLRREYLRLLFLHPYAKESKDAETHLWMQTSYSIISNYKQRISALDRQIFGPPRQAQQQQQQRQPAPQRNVVEYRKLLQRFRQFLAEEEKFWTQLIVRLQRNFAIESAQPALQALGFLTEQEPPPQDPNSPRRNQFQFPPESDEVLSDLLPANTSQRESRLAIFSKLLVCLGDIARYKEQYNESGGRPRAGHEDGPPAVTPNRGGRGGRRGGAPPALPVLARMRVYDRSVRCYEQSRLLTPHDGNPSHQLAIISSYKRESFESLAHYYRALCVRQPYEPASENMGSVLHRALEQWKGKQARGFNPDISPFETIESPRVRVITFQEKIIILHGQWRFGGNDVEGLNEDVIDHFKGIVADRVLPEEMIKQVIILAEGALWKHRMIRPTSHTEKRHPRSPLTESRMATHLLGVHRALLEVGSIELDEAPPSDGLEHDLAQRITATFRRTLVALRMSGKWIRANTRYLSQAKDSTDPDVGTNGAHAPKSRRTRDGRNHTKEKGNPVVIIGLRLFWQSYVEFMNILVEAFPIEGLPTLKMPLEEDVEMTGFLPLRKYMLGDAKGAAHTHGDANNSTSGSNDPEDSRPPGREKVHPNEEQLMRISDILVDAKAVAEDEVTPITFGDKGFTLDSSFTDVGSSEVTNSIVNSTTPSTVRDIKQVARGNAKQEHTPLDADARSEIDDDLVSRTDTDPVRDAFNEALELNEDNDNDEILYLRPAASPDPILAVHSAGPQSPHTLSPTSPISPRSPPYSPNRVQPISPPKLPLKSNATSPPAPPAPTQLPAAPTAADLLAAVMSGTVTFTPKHPKLPSDPMLFSSSTGPSIWSATPGPESNALRYQGGATSAPTNHLVNDPIHRPPPLQHHESPVAPPPQPPWSRPHASQPIPTSYLTHSSPWDQGLPALEPIGHHRALSQSTASVNPIGHQRMASESLYQSRTQVQQFASPSLAAPRVPQYNSSTLLPPMKESLHVSRGSQSGFNSAFHTDPIYSSSPNPAAFYLEQDSRTHFASGGFPAPIGTKVEQRAFAPFSSSSIWSNHG